MKKVCIIGGGFGGLYTAVSLCKLNIKVTLIDPKDSFTFLPLLYEYLNETSNEVEVSPSYRDLLNKTKVQFIKSFVSFVDPQNNLIVLQDGNKINYDCLIVAVGCHPNTDTIIGARENAITFSSMSDAITLRNKLKECHTLGKIINVNIIGGSYSGVELALSISSHYGKENSIINIIDRNKSIMSNASQFNRESAQRKLSDSNIRTMVNTSVTKITSNSVLTKENDSDVLTYIDSDIAICTTGLLPNKLLSAIPNIQLDEYGRIVVEETLQAANGPSNIFALGDCASVKTQRLPCTAQVAMQQSQVLARNIVTFLENPNNSLIASSLQSFQYNPLGEMLSLGNHDATLSALHDRIKLRGVAASATRRFVYALRMPTRAQRIGSLAGIGFSAIAELIKRN